MEIRVLKYFLAVANEESILRASQKLHLSQPTLSRQLMDLEDSLGKKLFVRSSKGITLTDEGMLLRQRAEEIVDLIDKTENEIRSDGENVSGYVYIGAGETEAVRYLARAAREIQAENPDIHYHLFSGNAENVMERLDKGLIDFGLLLDANDTVKYDSVLLPASDRFGVLMRKDSPLADRTMVTFKDLKGYPLIISAQMHYDRAEEKTIKRLMASLDVVATYNLVYNASIFVEEGFGYAIAFDNLIKTSGDSPLCFVPLEAQRDIQPYLVWKKDKVFSKAAELFLNKMKETFGE